VRLTDYYSRLIRDGHRGRPTINDARADFRRDIERQIHALRVR
jgi:hypothetical protein